MKKKIFLILFLSLFIGFYKTINTKAETANFYEAEYIDGIYMNKYQYSTQTIYYQKARFFRKSGTNEYAYCIEPFKFFNSEATYESTLTPNNLSAEQLDRIKKIAHFGYGYGTHNGTKWYAVAQMMIWQTADTNGDYYFTDTLNGNRINAYQKEINEINNLIDNYSKLPSFNNQTYTIVEGQELTIVDENNVLSNYQNNNNLIINNNNIIIKDLSEGEYEYTLTKQNTNYNTPIIFYQANNSQALIKTGYLDSLYASFKVKVINTDINITKIDKDTKSILPRGQASLDGAEYEIYDENMKKIANIIIKDNIGIISNLNFGKYYIKELTPGVGYTIDDTTYEVNITPDNPHFELILENKVIEKEIHIHKDYGEDSNWESEPNTEFEVYNNNNELINTLITDNAGNAKIRLPYGEYKIIQKSTKPGYYKADSFTININNQETEEINLKDLRIPVPNTHTESIIIRIIKILINVIKC